MKKVTLNILITIALLFFVMQVQSQTYRYNDTWGDAGLTRTDQSSSGMSLNFSIEEFSLVEHEIDGEVMQDILLSDVILPNNEGAPNLPGFSRMVAVPQGATVVVKINDYRIETVSGVEIAPAPRIPFENEDGPLQFIKDRKIYSTNAYYPVEPVVNSPVSSIRGVDFITIGITPFQYNPVSGELMIYRDIRVEVSFEGGNGMFGDNRLRSRWFDPILEDVLLNYGSLPQIDYIARNKAQFQTDVTGFEYIIVVPNDPIWMPYAEQIKQFRSAQGISTGIVALNDIGGSTTTILENYFNNAYNTWDVPPVAVLLMADYGTNATNSIISPIWNSYCASDNIFADVNNNDMPDIIFARMTAQNATHLQTMVSKMIDYETNPPTDPNFYNKPITALGWQTERWFQICSEVVGGYWREVQGRNPVRINAIYSGTPGTVWSTATNTSTVVNYFGPSGLGYIPATPAELGGWSGGTANQVVNAINDGAYALQHRDHGYEQGWGEPSFTSTNINSLTNTADNEFVFVFSINCLTGKYNMSGECFTEKFHRHTYNGLNAGALGLIAASEVSYSFVNDVYVWGMMDNMEPDFMPAYGSAVEERGFLPAFGNAAGKYFLQQSSWPYNTSNKEVTYNLFHHHGGAFMQLFTEVPQNLTVSHDPVLYSGETSLPVNANIGSFIALTVDGEIIGTAQGTGSAVSIQIDPQVPPAEILVTVTKQNYFRYAGTVEVIPPSGPYVVFDSYEINDYVDNNGNGQMDYGETIWLTMTLKNVGVEMANNVSATLSTTDQYVTLSGNTATFGNIPAESSVTVTDAYVIDVANNIPNGHSVSFQLDASDAVDATWTSYFAITGYAPAIEIEGYVVNDAAGNNNGILDPGETAPVEVFLQNNGGATAFNVFGELSSTDPYVSVLTGDPQTYGNLEGSLSQSATFTLSASASTPYGYLAEVLMDITADFGIAQQGTLEFSFADYCEATTSTEDEWIANVLFGDINNSSGWQNAVANYTHLSTELEPGVPEAMTVTNGNAWASDMVTVWIDWNMNMVFDQGTNEEYILTNVGGSGLTFTGNITPPANQLARQYRMRIRMTYSSAPQPCGASTYGEVEDYTVIVGSALPPPQNLQATLTDDDVLLQWDMPANDALQGFNIYRNGTKIAGPIPFTQYLDQNLTSGIYSYTVCAVYPEGISDPAGPVIIQIGGPEITLSPESFDVTLESGNTTTRDLEITNNGNLDLNWDISISYQNDNGENIIKNIKQSIVRPDPAMAEKGPGASQGTINYTDDPYDLQFEFACGDASGEAGAETDGNFIYTTKWNGTGQFFKYQLDGTFLGEFTITGAAAVRDLAYDGTYMYGAAANTSLFQMDFDNQLLVSTMSAAVATRAIAYDEGEDGFWANNWSTNPTLYDRSGATLNSFAINGDESFYG
nr:hypothetical protein [Bacteroidota bacterium]